MQLMCDKWISKVGFLRELIRKVMGSVARPL